MLSMSNTEMLINAFMTSRLDYCNALLGGCSARLINKLQTVQNAAARVLTRTRKYDHISPVLSTLHWLPIKHRIYFKILLITYKALNGLAPQYLSELLLHYRPPHPLRSEFWFLAIVASGLLSWGHFISSDITDLIAQILFKLTMKLLNSIMKCL